MLFRNSLRPLSNLSSNFETHKNFVDSFCHIYLVVQKNAITNKCNVLANNAILVGGGGRAFLRKFLYCKTNNCNVLLNHVIFGGGRGYPKNELFVYTISISTYIHALYSYKVKETLRDIFDNHIRYAVRYAVCHVVRYAVRYTVSCVVRCAARYAVHYAVISKNQIYASIYKHK